MRNNEENARKVLLCITTYAGLYGFPPSIRELCRMCGYKSAAVVRHYIKQLEKEGWLTLEPSIPETIVLRNTGRPMHLQRTALPVCG